MQAVTDSLFGCATRNATLSGPVKSGSPVFVYRFDHVMSFGPAVWGANYSFCDDKVRACASLTPPAIVVPCDAANPNPS